MSQRTQRLGDLVRAELAVLLQREMRDPRVALATITGVEVTTDLRYARVRVSALGDEPKRLETVAALEHAKGFLRRALAQRLDLRVTPELRFELDRGAEHSQHISDLLDSLAATDDGAEPEGDLDPAALLARLRAGTRFLLTSHVNPDGDAIGSELGLARVLGALGKRARIWNRDAAPALYAPLPAADRIHVGPEPPADFPGGTDAVIVLECPSLERTGLEGAFGGLPLINIDHHLGNQHYGAVNWVEPAAPAVGVMVHELAVALGATVGDDAASCLYLALVTDTGGFRFANATAPAFEAAARLVAAGANVERVSHWLYESQPEPSIRLLGELLATLGRHDGGRVATVSLDLEAFARAGAAPGDSEGLIDVPRSIAGVEAVALLRELPGGEWKISLRSRGDVDVAAVAASRGGGGHKNAAGCRAEGTLSAVRDSVVADLARAVGAVHDS